MLPASLCINFDSLRTIASHRLSLRSDCLPYDRDPCFFAILDRFISLLDEYKIKATIYVIGKDLEITLLAQRVKALYSLGHEIANHTYSHPTILSSLSTDEISKEIRQAHEIITNTLGGQAPVGFFAPAWSTSSSVINELIRLRYGYDTSLCPSLIMPLAQINLKFQSLISGSCQFAVFRKDFFGNLYGSRGPFFATPRNPWGIRSKLTSHESDILTLPLPTTSMRVGFWHTWAFRVSRSCYARMLKDAMTATPYFYLLTHPIDLLDPVKDLVGFPSQLLGFERMRVSLEEKVDRLRLALDILCSERRMVRMDQLAFEAKRNLQSSALL